MSSYLSTISKLSQNDSNTLIGVLFFIMSHSGMKALLKELVSFLKRNSLFLLFQPLMRNTYLYLPKWKESGFLWWWRFIKDHNHTSLCIFKELKYIFSISLLITVVLQQQTEFLPCDSGLRYSNCFGSWALSTLADFWGDWKTRILTGTRKYSPTPTPPTHKPSSRKIRQSGEGWYDVIGWGWWVRLHS